MRAYDDIWILGDRFLTKSTTVMERFFKLAPTQGEVKIQVDPVSYISTNYDVHVYSGNDTGSIRSVLGRLHNTLAYALNKIQKLPKYVLLVLEDSIIPCVDFDKPGVSELYGCDINWLVTEFKEMIDQRKKYLPPKAKRFLYPQLFWVLLPPHRQFQDSALRVKFNTCVEAVVAQYREMKILKLRKHWDQDELDLVDDTGCITFKGIWKFWMSVDEALEFWEHGKYKNKMYSVRSGREFITHTCEQHKTKEANFHRAPFRKDCYQWRKNKQVELPKPPPRH